MAYNKDINSSPYKITVKVRQNELTPTAIEQRVTDFQNVFANVASRYLKDKLKGEHE